MTLTCKVFADGAELSVIAKLCENPLIRGFTTNPTLMRKAGISDYESFAIDALKLVGDRPISFEVFSDDFIEMERQALYIASWGENVYVKIPITNTKREPADELVQHLSEIGVKVNVTALMTLSQVRRITTRLSSHTPSVISIFAGRIADAGIDPVPVMRSALEITRVNPAIELLWASPRELINVVQASDIGCHIITATPDILSKLPMIGRDLDDYSLDTVKMFYSDGIAAGFKLATHVPFTPRRIDTSASA